MPQCGEGELVVASLALFAQKHALNSMNCMRHVFWICFAQFRHGPVQHFLCQAS
jgi:hypothetical protein